MASKCTAAYANDESCYRMVTVGKSENSNKKVVSIKKGDRIVKTFTILSFSSPSEKEEKVKSVQ